MPKKVKRDTDSIYMLFSDKLSSCTSLRLWKTKNLFLLTLTVNLLSLSQPCILSKHELMLSFILTELKSSRLN